MTQLIDRLPAFDDIEEVPEERSKMQMELMREKAREHGNQWTATNFLYGIPESTHRDLSTNSRKRQRPAAEEDMIESKSIRTLPRSDIFFTKEEWFRLSYLKHLEGETYKRMVGGV
jgi:hypothetical protein